jgi:hypothetical protein
MKKLILIVIISMSFLACEKQSVTPEKQLLTVEVCVNEIGFASGNFQFILNDGNIDYRESKIFSYDSNAIIFKYQVFAEINKPINLGIVTNYDKPLTIIAYVNDKNQYFKVDSKTSYSIKITDNEFQKVTIE